MPVPAYGIFEGGGAKGLGHVAALSAAETNDVQFIGVAGASAGALIAALVAVGYKANELFDPRNPAANLLSRHAISPLSLIDEKAWRRFQKATKQARRSAIGAFLGGASLSALLGWSAARVAWEVKRTGGYFSTATVREHLNYFLRNKVREHHALAGRNIPVPEWITFKDIDPNVVPECCSLKVIVTDITNQCPVVFGSSSEHADVRVAEAVAASIAIPLVFKPARIPSYRDGKSLYADGGLVSNLPIWVFTEEKLNFERTKSQRNRVPILGFSLVGDKVENLVAEGDLFRLMTAVGRSAIFGGQTVVHDFVADLVSITIPVDLGTTEFEFTLKRALDAYYAAHVEAARYLVSAIRIKPAQVNDIMKEFHDGVLEAIKANAPTPPIANLRLSLIKPVGARSFRVSHGFNMTMDADDRLSFSSATEGAPDAYKNRRPALINYPAIAGDPNYPMTKYEKALLRRGLHSGISVPVFADIGAWQMVNASERPEPLGVVSIDSDDDLSHIFRNSAIIKQLAIASLRLSKLFQPEGT